VKLNKECPTAGINTHPYILMKFFIAPEFTVKTINYTNSTLNITDSLGEA
jgi:hypothetical protein